MRQVKFVNTKFETEPTEVSIKDIETLSRLDRTGYEWIDGRCVPYYDFDYHYLSRTEQRKHHKADLIKSRDAVKKVFPDGILYETESIGLSNGKHKNSFHIIVRGVGYANCGKALPVVTNSDSAVYANEGKRQLFRPPGFSKEGEKRPVKMLTKAPYRMFLVSNIENEELKYNTSVVIKGDVKGCDLIESHPFMRDKIYKSSSVSDGITFHKYEDLLKRECDFCKRMHEDNQAYGMIIDSKILIGCRKFKGPKVFIHSYKKIKQTKPHTKIEIFKAFKGVYFNEKYCDNFQELKTAANAGIDIALSSNMGTGKTVFSSRHAMGVSSAGAISFRISLANKYKTDYKDFVCYNDKKGAILNDKWICQMDSLYRVKAVPKVLYLDEVSQLRRHMSADTFLKNKNYLHNVDKIELFIKDCKQLIIMDANLSPVDLQWIHTLRGSTPRLFINEACPRKQTISIETEQSIIRCAMENIRNGEKFVIAHNGGKRHHEPLRRKLGGNILLINGDTMNEENVINALADPNKEFGKYDGIIYSSCVQSGLSYDVLNTFSNIYGIFSNCTNSSGDACQMLNRIRDPINKVIKVSIQEYKSSASRTIAELKSVIEANRQHLNDDGFMSNHLLSDLCKSQIEMNLDRLHFKDNFIWYNMMYGNEVIINEVKSDNDIDQKKDLLRFSNEIKTEEAVLMNDAINLTLVEVNKLKARLEDNLTILKEEVIALKKYNLLSAYKMDEPINDPAWYETYSDSKLKQVYYNTSIYFESDDLEETLEIIKENDISRDVRARYDGEAETINNCVIANMIKKPVYQINKLLIGFIQKMGFTMIDDPSEIEEVLLKRKVLDIMEGLTLNDLKVMGSQSSLKKIALEKTSFKKSLQIINGAIRKHFQISVKKKHNHSSCYILFNKNLGSVFSTEKNSANMPILGNNRMVPVLYEEEEEEPSEYDQMQQLLE